MKSKSWQNPHYNLSPPPKKTNNKLDKFDLKINISNQPSKMMVVIQEG